MKQAFVRSGPAEISRVIPATDCPPFSADPTLSLILPCLNEETNIEPTIRAAQQWFRDAHIDGEIVVTDDGSTDGSPDLLRRLQTEMPNLKVVHHQRNAGYGAAIRSGCDRAEKRWIAFMDSDGQFRAADISLLLPITRTADYVSGIRIKRADTFQRKLNSLLYSLLVRVILGVHPKDLNCGMKLFRRSLWPTIRPEYATGALINGEMFLRLKHAGIRWAETPVPHYPRLAGKPTGANLRVILRTFKELWQLKYSRKSPLVHSRPSPRGQIEPSPAPPNALSDDGQPMSGFRVPPSGGLSEQMVNCE
jgi:glycosyltransferase involved in cell wall biosynthesis